MISTIIPTFNDAEKAINTAKRLKEIAISSNCELEILIVDDGSSAEARKKLQSYSEFKLILNEKNLGRAVTRNRGASLSTGESLLFIDSDCFPVNNSFLRNHLKALKSADISIGPVLPPPDNSFWSKYQKKSAQRRSVLFKKGYYFMMTSANFMIKTKLFNALRGFDPSYSRYGFEDRDFFIRAHVAGAKFSLTEDAAVIHKDNLNLTSVLRKMNEAGKTTSSIFEQRHPLVYRKLGYAAIDTRYNFLMKGIIPFFPILMHYSTILDKVLEVFPFFISNKMAKLFIAIAYAHGTFNREYAKNLQ